MKPRTIAACLTLILASPALSHAQSKKIGAPSLNDVLPLLDAGSPQALSGVLRGVLVKHLPNPLYADSPGWGDQRMVANQLKWHRKGIFLKPKIYKAPKNHGAWRKIRITGNNLPNTLILDIRNVNFPQPDRMMFDVFLAFDARAEYTHHVWRSGIRLYAGSVRARFRVNLHLSCEATVKVVPTKTVVPDAVFRMKATHAHLSYSNLVFEHVPGIGGTAANLIGKAFHGMIKQWRPSLERNLLAKANKAIVKGADTKEVRLSLSRMFEHVLKDYSK